MRNMRSQTRNLAAIILMTLSSPLWVFGQSNALDFDGANDYVTLTGYKGILGTNPRTVEAWIRVPVTATNHAIVSWGQNTAGNKVVFRVQNTNGQAGAIRLEVNGGYIVGTTDLRDNQWHHVAFSWENDGTPNVLDADLYVDGALEGTSASLTEPINTVSGIDVMIAARHGPGAYFNGRIDELRIWDDVRSLAEIQNNMCDIPTPATEPNLVAYYKFDQTTGAVLPDLAGSNDGTLLNMTNADWVTGTCAPMTYVSSLTVQDPIANLEVCASNASVLRLEVVTTGSMNPIDLSQIVARTDGSTAPLADIDSLEVYYTGNDPAFSTATFFGSALPASVGTDILINGTQTLVEGTNYFWITYSMYHGATVGNLIDGACTQVTVDGSNQVPTTTAPAGNRPLIDCGRWCPGSATVFSETFDGSVIEGANSSVIYGNGGSDHNASYPISGTYFGWFNIVNGLSNVDLYDRRMEGFYDGCEATVTYSARQSFGGMNIDVSMIDDNGVVLSTQNHVLSTTHTVYTHTFTPTTPGVRFHIFSSSTGSPGGVDLVIEDILVTQCCDQSPFLPIELADFRLSCQASQVKVAWRTISESNNDYFTVERSDDGKDFEVIGSVAGAGNSTSNIDYQFIDKNPISDGSYYRLGQTDFNGRVELFDVLELDCQPEERARIFPNPCEDHLKLSFGESEEADYSVRISNLLGQVVLSKELPNASGIIRIDLKDQIPNGIYNFELIRNKAVVYQEKFSKR